MSNKENLYKILEVEETASQDEIKKSYRRLSKIYHPDVKKTGDESRFKKIAEAYEILTNPEKKAKYENEGAFNGEHGFGGFNSSMMDELFRNFGGGGFHFGGGRRHNQNMRPRGGDLRIKIPITLQETVLGVHKKIKIQRDINCRICSGSGAENPESIVNCSTCNGTGTFTTRQNTQFGSSIVQRTCPSCNGKATEIKSKCKSCDGQGLMSQVDNVEFDIPAGAISGIDMNINNLGNEARGGGDNGNLIIEIIEIEHPSIKREGIDVFSDVFISYYDAVIGSDSVEVDTIDGVVKIKVEPGTESGKMLRLKGKGIPNINEPSKKGDQLIFVNIFIPKVITEEEREAISKLNGMESAEPNKEKTQHIKGIYSRIREYDELH